MEKDQILEAIRRCAEENGGVAVGRARFERLTGIREGQWAGRYWLRWSDAVAEAGYSAASMNSALPDEVVLDALVRLIRELGHYPVTAEFRMRRRADPSFPDHKVYRRFGTKPSLAARVIEHVGKDPDLRGVVAICQPIAALVEPASESADEVGPDAGQVYLMKSGSHYKIGRSNAAGRRAYELAIQLPEKLQVIHVIDTDDAVGIERYWHLRFGHRRANGEWNFKEVVSVGSRCSVTITVGSDVPSTSNACRAEVAPPRRRPGPAQLP